MLKAFKGNVSQLPQIKYPKYNPVSGPFIVFSIIVNENFELREPSSKIEQQTKWVDIIADDSMLEYIIQMGLEEGDYIEVCGEFYQRTYILDGEERVWDKLALKGCNAMIKLVAKKSSKNEKIENKNS